MSNPFFVTGAGGAMVACIALLSAPAISATPCEALARLSLPETIHIAAHDVPAGPFTPPGATEPIPGGDLPAFCRVQLTVKPQINIEVWLPKDTWNKRYRGEGGGGYVGFINYWGLADALRAGYATANTDTGHRYPWSADSVRPSLRGAFALNADGSLNRQLIVDFASRSLHEMVLKAKRLIKAYYGTPPRYSYWRGASTGGRQGLLAVQRFPEEYDGVLAGMPAINWDRFIPSDLWPQIVMHQEVGHPISAIKLEAVTKAAVAACDANDGVVDGLINDPRKCSYDPSALVCNGGNDPNTCLTPQEANGVRKIWEGPKSAKSGERLWFGLERGASFATLAAAEPFRIASDYFKYWIKQDPIFDWHTLTEEDFEQSMRESSMKFNDVIGTDQADLKRLREHGGKVLMWHGESDGDIVPRGTLNYFERVLAANGGARQVDKFARLFLLPGTGHGPRADAPFPHSNPASSDPMFDALVDWVERSIAPDRILASQKLPDGSVRTRPLELTRFRGEVASWDITLPRL